MKKFARMLAAFCLLQLPLLAQDPVWVSNADIKDVRIYQNGAMVSRTAKATLNPGIQEVVFDGLSPYINPQSIMLKGTGDATILSVTFQTNYLKEKKKSKEVQRLEGDLDSLTLRLQQVRNKIAVLTETQSLLTANKSIGGANNGVLADELEPMVDYFIKKMGELKQDQLEEQQKEKKLNEQVGKLQQQLNTLRAKNDQPTGNIIVKVNAGARGMAGFDFSYVIQSNVSWYAFYDLKAKDVNSPFELVYKAKVNQSSGEDWNQVKLSLSTGNPSIGNDRPVLYPWMLNYYMPVALYGKQGAVPMAAPVMQEQTLAAGARDREEDAKVAMKAIEVNVSQNALNSSFDIMTPYTIPSDGQEYQVEIQKYNLQAEYNYVAIPKLDADAFLTAKITGWEDLSLSPGGANIYFDGAYVGESYINPAESNDTLEISLGRDKRIVVKREKLKDLSGNKLFGGNKERNLSYDITVKNGKKEAISLILLDQVPVSMQKDIEVKIDELSGAEYNSETGEVKWKMQIPAGETTKKRLTFKVKYPKDKQIMGL
ncbi:MAG: mucoidy inhibitor MuiA family protein [Bacteroidia bacterium]